MTINAKERCLEVIERTVHRNGEYICAACGGPQIKFGPFCRREKDLRTNERKNYELEMRMKDDVPDKEIESGGFN